MILVHASWHASSPSLARSLSLSPPFALSLRPPVSHFLSFPRFTLFFAVSPTSPSFISGSFHPRLSSRAHSAVTKIDFLARTRERAGEERDMEYIALSRPSFDFSISADARRSVSPFYPFFPPLPPRAFPRPLPRASPVKFSTRLIKKKEKTRKKETCESRRAALR